LVLMGDVAIEPLVAFLHDPDASKVEKESERVMAFASTRLTASSALKKWVLDTLEKLGWEPLKDDDDQLTELQYTDPDKVLGEEGRFGASGDFARPAKGLKIER